jgi:hypothetical protein
MGTGCSQPSDHRSTTKINPERERGLTSGPGVLAVLGQGWLTGRAQLQGLGEGTHPSGQILIGRVRSDLVYLKPLRQISDGHLRSNDKIGLGSWVASGGAA